MPIDKTPWTDEKVMPWGKHKGTKLEDIPADYFVWLEAQDWLKSWPGLHAYIVANWSTIQEQADEDRTGLGDIDGPDGFDSWEDYQRYGK